jgi:hypothetical protein
MGEAAKNRDPMSHGALVQRYVARGFESHGFRRAMADALSEGRGCKGRCVCTTDECERREWYEAIRDEYPRVPDGYRIDLTNRRLELLEVEVTSLLTPSKIDDVISLTWMLDFYGWSVEVLRVDRFGVERRWRVQHEELACG